jgi:hypothetical protein
MMFLCLIGAGTTSVHLLSFCSYYWCMIYFTYNLPPSTNITNMLGNWLNRMPKDDKAIRRIGVSTLCWSLWTYQNNIIFNK